MSKIFSIEPRSPAAGALYDPYTIPLQAVLTLAPMGL